MKLLFALALCAFSAPCFAAKTKAASGSASAPAATVAPAAAEPEAPRERKPGFWERAWASGKKTTGRVWGTTKKVGNVFHRGKSKSDDQGGWHQLSMSMTLDPVTVKLPDAKSVRVSVVVVNTGKTATQLDFPTTQRIEVVLKNDSGKVVSKWSEDQKLDEEQGFLVVNPEERLEYTATISTREMQAGQTYLIEAFFPNFDQLRASRTVVPVK